MPYGIFEPMVKHVLVAHPPVSLFVAMFFFLLARQEDDSDFDDEDMSDEGMTPTSSPRRRKSLASGNGSGTNGEMSDPQSPVARGQPPGQPQVCA